MFVYLITNTIDGKRYVGQTIRSLKARWSSHCSTARRGRGLHLHAAIRKYGESAFTIEMLISADSRDLLDQEERRYIAQFRANDPELGYNLTVGGQGLERGYFRPLTMEHRKRISAARHGNNRSGCKHTEETRRKISASNMGRKPAMPNGPVTDAHKAALSAALKGNRNSVGAVRSPEVRQRMSEGQKARIARRKANA